MLVREFATEGVAKPERLALFEDVAGRLHMPSRLHSEHQEDFRAKTRVLPLGDVQFFAHSVPQLRITRTHRLVRQEDPEVYQVICFLAGEARLVQAGRDHHYRAGQIALVDSSHPFEIDLRTPADTWSLAKAQCPRSLLPLPERTTRRLIATPIPADRGMGALLHRWLAGLNGRAHEFAPADVPALAQGTTDLLAGVLAQRADAEESLTPETHGRALRARIHAFVEQHLSDPDLCPQTLADAHHISLRQLHRLWAEEETTPAAWIRHRRLERCRRDLVSPRMRTAPVAEIAARWGFADPAHFSRTFRAAYGQTPRAFRNASSAGVP